MPRLGDGIKVKEPEFGIAEARTMPDSGVISEPLCSFSVTGPSVVGFQDNVVGSPAVNLKPPGGTLKALSAAAARSTKVLRTR